MRKTSIEQQERDSEANERFLGLYEKSLKHFLQILTSIKSE